jgi:hypothetical protein
VNVLIPLLLGSSALAFAPSDDVHIGIEPQRIMRFHSELQHKLRNSSSWQGFLDAEGAGWDVRFDERAGTVYRAWGPGIDVGSPASVQEAADAVLTLLENHPDLLGVSADALALGRSGYDAERDTFYIQLDRIVPEDDSGRRSVEQGPTTFYRSGVLARIKYGKLILLGIATHPDAPDLGDPTLYLDDAVNIAIGQGPHPSAAHEYVDAKTVVLPVEAGSGLDYRLTWEIRTETQSPRGIWVSYVDAHSGDLINVHNEVRYVSGTISAEHDTRNPESGFSTSVLTYLNVESDSGDRGQTDTSGNYSVSGSAITAALRGENITVSNQEGGDASIYTQGNGVFNESGASMAEIDTYHFLTETIKWADQYAPSVNAVWYDYYGTVVSNVNINSSCNAYYDGNVNFYRAGSGCNNTGRIADVIYHEWGHGFHYTNIESGNIDGSISEGVGDCISTFFTEDSTIAPFFSTNGSGIREVSSNRVYPEDVVNQVHTDGLIFGGAVWDFWGELSDTYDDEIDAREALYNAFVGGMKGGPDIPAAYDEFVVADDDDGDLGNGTPHLCELIEGFSLHGLGPGGSSALIEISHEQVGNQPAEDTDISVDFLNLAELCSDGDLQDAEVVYSTNDGETWDRADLDVAAESAEGLIPAQQPGTKVLYYIEGETTEGTAVRAPEGGSITPISYYVGDMVEVFCTDFEDDDGGFTSELLSGEETEGADDWMYGTPGGLEGDPAFAYSGDKVWGNDLGGTIDGQQYNGAYQSEKHNRLLSPMLDVSEFNGPYIVQFQRWLTVEDGYYDIARVTVNDQAGWENHATEYAVGDEHHRDSMWALQTVIVDDVSDGMLQIGWEIESDGGLEFGGWNIDDFCVYAMGDSSGNNDDDNDGTDDDGIDNGGDSLGDSKNDWSSGCSHAPSRSLPARGLLAGMLALTFIGLRRRR